VERDARGIVGQSEAAGGDKQQANGEQGERSHGLNFSVAFNRRKRERKPKFAVPFTRGVRQTNFQTKAVKSP
jgi:hypothetical protein